MLNQSKLRDKSLIFKKNKPYFRFISQDHPGPQQTDTS